MALLKTSASLADTNVPVGTAKGAVKSAVFDVLYGIDGVLRIANGASGPTAGAKCAVQVRQFGSGDDNDWRDLCAFQAGIASASNDGVYDFPFHVEPGIGQCRYIAWDNTGQAVAFSVKASRVDSY